MWISNLKRLSSNTSCPNKSIYLYPFPNYSDEGGAVLVPTGSGLAWNKHNILVIGAFVTENVFRNMLQ